MSINHAQVLEMLRSIATARPDALDCDGCFALLSEFAECKLIGKPLSDALRMVEVHLSQCPCCAYEYETLLESIRAADDVDHGSPS